MGKQTGLKRKREGKDAEEGEALTSWFSNVRQKQQTVTGAMLREKAEFFGHGYCPLLGLTSANGPVG